MWQTISFGRSVSARAMITRLRIALDLPSRSEIAELTSRLEELDRRFAQLADARIATPVRTTLAPVEAAPVVAAPVASDAAPAVDAAAVETEAASDAASDAADGDDAADATAVDGAARLSRKERRRQQASKTTRR